VTGAVTALLDAGLLLTLLAVDDGLARDIDELKITVRLRCGFHWLLIIVTVSVLAAASLLLFYQLSMWFSCTVCVNFCVCSTTFLNTKYV